MKKKIILSSFIFSLCYFKGQIGINTDFPKATLDINAKNPIVTSDTNEGLLIPQLSRLRVANMISPSVSTLVYINDITNGIESGKTEFVTSTGFYYFDGFKWIKLNSANSNFDADNGLQIINGKVKLGGILNRSTTIETSANNILKITGISKNAFSVNENTLSVDAKDSRVGIGTNTPLAKFHVKNENKSDEIARFVGIDDDNLFKIRATLLNNGNFGLGALNPLNKLHVVGDTQITGALKVGGNSTSDGSPGAVGQILVSNGNNTPTWQNITNQKGVLAAMYQVKGTTKINITPDSFIDVPGLKITHTVPNWATNGQIVFLTLVGFVHMHTPGTIAPTGRFIIQRNNENLASGLAAVANHRPPNQTENANGVGNIPVPAVVHYFETLMPGTHTYVVKFKGGLNSGHVNEGSETSHFQMQVFNN